MVIMALLDTQYYHNQLKRTLTGDYAPHGDISKADCVVATGFGYRMHDGQVLPSITTRQIAEVVHQFEHLPKILSHDVAAAYAKLFPHDPAQLNELIHPEHLTTMRFVHHIRDMLHANEFKNPLLLAHQHHLPWVDYLCGQMNIMTVVPAGLAFDFDPVSVLPWTRDEDNWQREIQARLAAGYADDYHETTYKLRHD